MIDYYANTVRNMYFMNLSKQTNHTTRKIKTRQMSNVDSDSNETRHKQWEMIHWHDDMNVNDSFYSL